MQIQRFVAAFQAIKGRYRRHALVALLLLAAVLLFGSAVRLVAVIAALILIASLSTFYHNFFRSPLNFELVKLATIVSSVAYGAFIGVLIGVASDILGRALSGRLDQDTITSLGALIIVAILASVFRTANITLLGILLVIAYYVMILPFIFMFGKDLGRASIYIGSNLLLNVILFVNVAPFLLRVIG